MFLAVIAIAVAFGAGGYFLGQQLESPEDARAEVEAPEPSKIAVPVEAVALSNDVVVRGDAQFEGALDLELDASLGDGSSRVVTGRVPDIDTVVEEGDVLIEVSERPVFVLEGALPAFREFKPGTEGDDVLQLEESLARLGFLQVPPDSLYGAATEEAISAMYEAVGYEPRSADEGQEASLDTARAAVERARESLADANDGLADALKGPSQAEQVRDNQTRRDLVQAVEDAKEALVEAEDNRPSPAYLAAIDAVTQAELAGETQSLGQLQASAIREADADRERVEAAKEQITAAEQRLADADALTAAENAEGIDASREQGQVEDAAKDLADAEADLAELEEKIGVRLPIAEVVFLPNLPRTVTSVNVARGDAVTGSVMRISGTEVRITTGVSEANRPLLEVGQRVIIDSESLGLALDGEIIELADRTGTNGVADTRYYMLVKPTGEYSVTDLVGINFRLQIPLERSEGEVLAVPLAALSAGADGTSRVEVLLDNDESELVPVEVGLSDKNRSLVEITSLGREITADDLVVIGIEQISVPVAAPDDTDDGDTDEGETEDPAEDSGSEEPVTEDEPS